MGVAIELIVFENFDLRPCLIVISENKKTFRMLEQAYCIISENLGMGRPWN